MVKTGFQDRFTNAKLIWNDSFVGCFQQYMNKLDIKMDEKCKNRIEAIDNEKMHYNEKK